MHAYTCQNCSNLKNRIITPESLLAVSKYRLEKALKVRDTEQLGLDFPFNLTVYKRVKSHYDLPPKKWTQRRVGVSITTGS